MDTIRVNLVNMLNDIGTLITLTPKGQLDEKLKKLHRVGFILLEEVTKTSLDSTTDVFKTTLKELKTAQEHIDVAIKDIKKVKKAIEDIAQAIKTVDKLLQFGFGLLV